MTDYTDLKKRADMVIYATKKSLGGNPAGEQIASTFQECRDAIESLEREKEESWNAALEEAAKVVYAVYEEDPLDDLTWGCMGAADRVRSLKK